MHRQISSRKLAVFGIASAALYGALAATIPNRFLLEVFNCLFLGVVGTVTVVFFPLFLRAIRVREFDRVSQLTIGIILTWFSLILSRGVSVAIQATDEQTRLAATPLIAFAAYIAILGGILHVTAPGMLEGKWRYNKGILAIGLLVGAVIATVAIILQRNGIDV
jgi:4-amino-4-deoxy-L-arabinose transferase-like glycosyltransferase